ncbi:type VI secretion system tip protein VgrG [Vibrio sp. vnigr-6D03]|uniref:type VI secretion system Vgr family protein n=1 Tax=Vibrio sp. vnigr-6D03 TaxID=2058088 RepID=UPI000C31E5BA|nr:type VI secretion system tip protein VgrG [Vibrio sp. vnigr-6D03]PKF81398.1 type VI secretion system tip protein VgrG [Vibrio sp. vnigr-6D03]
MGKLSFSLDVEGLAPNTLIVREYQGQESLSHDGECHGFCYQIELASRSMDIQPNQVVDKDACLIVTQNGEVTQTVHGIVRAFFKGDTGRQHTFYTLTLVPAIERLSLRQNSRIFQNQSVPDILSVLFQEMGINDYAFSLKRSCQPREFCVQYRETDLAFMHRLAAEEGLVYRFNHEKTKHTIIFSDDSQTYDALPASITYNAIAGGQADTPYVFGFAERVRSDVTSVMFQEYSFKKPTYSFKQEQIGQDMSYQRDGYEHYDAPTRYKDDESGQAFSQYRLEFLRRESHTAQGKSNHAGLHAGVKFTLTDHLDPKCNRSWIVVKVTHSGTQPQALEEEGGSGATTYSNQFTVIPASSQWRATPLPKPQVDGPAMAMVVGPDGEEIFCDEHGRVKVHFPWDRYSNGDEHSSCWVRVSQEWAGSQFGVMAIPRIGHEVIVSFLNGDPDQPIITGRTYHAINTPPYALADNKTKTVIRTETHQGEGFNELSFEDQADNEKVYLHAQKDLEREVQNDSLSHIRHDEHATVDNDQFMRIKNARHLAVDGESRTKVTADQSLVVDGSIHQKAGSNWASEAATEIHLKSGVKIVLEAGSELTLKVGGNFVKVDPAGVHVVGSKINLNSGGSAGSGGGFGGQGAELPLELEGLAAPEVQEFSPFSASQQSLDANVKTSIPATPVMMQRIQSDSSSDMAITEICQKQPDGSCPLTNCPCRN